MENKTPEGKSNLEKIESSLVSAVLPDKDFEAITLEEKRKPKRILHFSDGVLEEYSSDEEDGTQEPFIPSIDPKSLRWIPYLWYYVIRGASKTLSVCDAMGEKLAWWLGITSPKYQYAIDEYNRLQEEEREELDQDEEHKDVEKTRVAEMNAKKMYTDASGHPGADPCAANI